MAFSDVTRGQGSFVSRTKKAFDEGLHAFTSAYEVSASTTYEPTSSFKPTEFNILWLTLEAKCCPEIVTTGTPD